MLSDVGHKYGRAHKELLVRAERNARLTLCLFSELVLIWCVVRRGSGSAIVPALKQADSAGLKGDSLAPGMSALRCLTDTVSHSQTDGKSQNTS